MPDRDPVAPQDREDESTVTDLDDELDAEEYIGDRLDDEEGE